MGEEQHVYVIATLKDLRPRWHEIAETIQNQKAFKDIKVKGLKLVEGPGCLNLGLSLEGPKKEAELLVKNLTLSLMPARYSQAGDKPWTGVFKQITRVKPDEVSRG